jgi:hypothetical protein
MILLNKNLKSLGWIILVGIALYIAQFLFHPLYIHKVVQQFKTPLIVRNGSTFGPKGEFTISLDQNGTFIIDGQSGYAWQKSDSYRDSAIIRSTNPLPKTYKISVIVGDIDYGLDKIDGLQNDPNFPEGPLNENGCYLLTIVDELPNLPHLNLWWHHHRKVTIDVDNNIWGQGMPNPFFMIYFDKKNTLVAYDGDQNTWQDDWNAVLHYYPNTFYKVEIEKTWREYILRIFTEKGQLIKEGHVHLNDVWHQNSQEYFVLGDPHENYYQGSMKIKEITMQY